MTETTAQAEIEKLRAERDRLKTERDKWEGQSDVNFRHYEAEKEMRRRAESERDRLMALASRALSGMGEAER